MAKFFVGQRVRVVADFGGHFPNLIGAEGVVMQVDDQDWTKWDAMYGLDIHPLYQIESGHWIGFVDGELEPVLPDGAKPSEFSSYEELMESLAGVAA